MNNYNIPMDDIEGVMTIQEMVKHFKVTSRTLRYYEFKGVLAPQKIGQKRLFSKKDRVRLRLTLRGKRIGLSIDDCLEIIKIYDEPSGKSKQMNYMLELVREKKDFLFEQKQVIEGTLEDLQTIEQRLIGSLQNAN